MRFHSVVFLVSGFFSGSAITYIATREEGSLFFTINFKKVNVGVSESAISRGDGSTIFQSDFQNELGKEEEIVDFKSKVSTATSGKVFSGAKTRSFPRSERKFIDYRPQSNFRKKSNERNCENWAVVTTIFSPSEATVRQAHLNGWCFVVAGDKKSPPEYSTGWFDGSEAFGWSENVVYLTAEMQLQMEEEAFVASQPFNNFARKNVGYLYAIAHGAKRVWDFDDDNLLYFWHDTRARNVPSLQNLVEHLESGAGAKMIEIEDFNHHSFNPYPMMHAPSLPCWPRGFPLQDIKVEASYVVSKSQLKEVTLEASEVGVVQSLADNQPDVDAMYRLTQFHIPFNFERQDKYEPRPVLIPNGALTPFNAQATLHTEKALWGLLLPITVTGRVSDIWRSYFMQRIGWDIGVRVAFASTPMVTQERNVHDLVGDLNSEQQLYTQANQLVDFLNHWYSDAPTLVARIEDLWIELYEREFIEKDDVIAVQLWLSALESVGYTFPKPIRFGPLRKAKQVVSNKKKSPSASSKHQSGLKCDDIPSLKIFIPEKLDKSNSGLASALADLGMKVFAKSTGNENRRKISRFIESWGPAFDSPNSAMSDDGFSSDLLRNQLDFWNTALPTEGINAADVFLCSAPAAACEALVGLGKPLFWAPVWRYNEHRCRAESWTKLNQIISESLEGSSLKNVFLTQGRLDKEYARYYLGAKEEREMIDLPKVPPGFLSMNHDVHNPSRYAAIAVWNLPKMISLRSKTTKLTDRTLFSEVSAVVFFPSLEQDSKFAELYANNIPLFVPSIKFMESLPVSEWPRISPCTGSFSAPSHPTNTHLYSPAEASTIALVYWMQFNDMYALPYITKFDSMDDLERKISLANLPMIREGMSKTNKQRAIELKSALCSALDGIKSSL